MQVHELRPEPSASPDSNEKQLRILLHGPCWCRGDSGTQSFDLTRYRKVDLGAFDTHLIVVSSRIIEGSRPVLRRLFAEVPDPKLVISVATCPASEGFWQHLAGGWTPLSATMPIDIVVEECISARPESLLAAVLEHHHANAPSRLAAHSSPQV